MELDLSPSTRLPYEIFRKIIVGVYEHMLVIPHERGALPTDLWPISPPIVASHVCRRWRYTLLSDESMWTCLSFPIIKPTGIMDLLRRSSGSTLLNVLLDLKESATPDSDNVSDMLSSLFGQIHRFGSLYVYVNPQTYDAGDNTSLGEPRVQALIQQILSYPAPNLHMFCLRNTDRDFHFPNAFQLDTPADCLAPSFHNLSRLSITTGTCSVSFYNHLLIMLRLSPCLKKLHISVGSNDVISFRFNSGHLPIPKINLPHLQHLLLEMNVKFPDSILGHITFPSTTKWYIAARDSNLSTPFKPFLSQLLSQAFFTSLHIDFIGPWTVEVVFEESASTKTKYLDRLEDNKFTYHFQLFRFTDFWNPLMGSNSSLNNTSIVNLDLQVGIRLGRAIFRTILASLPNLRVLVVRQTIVIAVNEGGDEPCLACLSALSTGSEETAISEIDPNVTLYEDSNTDNTTSSNSTAPTPGITDANLCPYLNRLLLKFERPLTEDYIHMLRACTDSRGDDGLQILVVCQGIEEDAEPLLKDLNMNVEIWPD